MKNIFNKFTAVSFVLALSLQLSLSAFAYTDLTPEHKYYEAVEFITEEDIVGGYPDGTYRADQTLNRAELLKIVIEANFNDNQFTPFADESCFDDVPAGEWFTPYVCFAKDLGVVKGYDDGNFRPNDKINLVEALKISLSSFGFAVEELDPWYKDIVETAAGRNFIPIDFQQFSQEISRGQMAELITRILKEDRNELNDYLGYLSEYRVNYFTLFYNLDVEKSPFEVFRDEDLELAFHYPAPWDTPQQLSEPEDADWILQMGSSSEYTLTAVANADDPQLPDLIIDQFLVDNLDFYLYEEEGICTDLVAAIVGAEHTFYLRGECLDSISEREDFFLILSSLDFSPSPELDVIADNPDTGNGGDDPLPEASEGYAIFESQPYKFTVEYPDNWYYYGRAGTEDGVIRHYSFYAEDPFPEEDTTEPAAPEVAALDVVTLAAPSGGETVAGGILIEEEGTVSIYLEVGPRKYRLTGLVDYQEALIHMAESITEITE